MSSTTDLVAGIFHSSIQSRRHGRLAQVARVIASLHPHAIDYIQQAPVLVLPHAQRVPRAAAIERDWVPLLEAQPKLRELMERFELAYQLRALHGCVLQPRHLLVLHHVSRVNPSTLAQALPARIGQQKGWLSNLYRWVGQMRHHQRDPLHHLEWAVQNLLYGTQVVTTIADFAAASEEFNPRWNLVQARAAAERWHTELVRERQTGHHRDRYGIDWSAPVDYGKLPLTLTIAGYEFVALRSAEDLFVEGQKMHNCVSSYFDIVHRGSSRIYSIRRDGAPIATLELGWSVATHTTIGVRQLKGPCNAAVPDEVSKVVTKFVKKVRNAS